MLFGVVCGMVGLEMEAKARAQSAGSQEFADFDNGKLRTGEYSVHRMVV